MNHIRSQSANFTVQKTLKLLHRLPPLFLKMILVNLCAPYLQFRSQKWRPHIIGVCRWLAHLKSLPSFQKLCKCAECPALPGVEAVRIGADEDLENTHR